MLKRHKLIELVLLMLTVVPAWAAIYTVFPGQSIQDAIDDASYGDTVQVLAGRYVENITLKNGIALIGAGESITIIDGNDAHCVVTSSACGSYTVLLGFTITNGLGGGMYNDLSSPTVIDCTFSGNSAFEGGGMHNYYSSPTITNCTFNGNQAYKGGGMYNFASDPTITNCTFSENYTRGGDGGGMHNTFVSNMYILNCTFSENYTGGDGDGGGMFNGGSDSYIRNCTFNGNQAYKGGGMSIVGSEPTITNCTFGGNSAEYGGGMYNDGCFPTVNNCTFSGNFATSIGGGMYNLGFHPTVINCIFSGNSSGYGGGMGNDSSDPTVTNCTFSGNTSYSGGGMYNDDSSPAANNCIFWGNSAFTNRHQITAENQSLVTIYYCDVQDASGSGVYKDGTSAFSWTGINIDSVPLYVDANGPDNELGTDDDNLHLLPGSPCIDAGSNDVVPAVLTIDLDHKPRLISDLCTTDTGTGTAPIVDMGAYEFLRSDINSNGSVNLEDFYLIAEHWLQVNCGLCSGADLTCDGEVDCDDLCDLAGYWLSGK